MATFGIVFNHERCLFKEWSIFDVVTGKRLKVRPRTMTGNPLYIHLILLSSSSSSSSFYSVSNNFHLDLNRLSTSPTLMLGQRVLRFHLISADTAVLLYCKSHFSMRDCQIRNWKNLLFLVNDLPPSTRHNPFRPSIRKFISHCGPFKQTKLLVPDV